MLSSYHGTINRNEAALYILKWNDLQEMLIGTKNEKQNDMYCTHYLCKKNVQACYFYLSHCL